MPLFNEFKLSRRDEFYSILAEPLTEGTSMDVVVVTEPNQASKKRKSDDGPHSDTSSNNTKLLQEIETKTLQFSKEKCQALWNDLQLLSRYETSTRILVDHFNNGTFPNDLKKSLNHAFPKDFPNREALILAEQTKLRKVFSELLETRAATYITEYDLWKNHCHVTYNEDTISKEISDFVNNLHVTNDPDEQTKLVEIANRVIAGYSKTRAKTQAKIEKQNENKTFIPPGEGDEEINTQKQPLKTTVSTNNNTKNTKNTKNTNNTNTNTKRDTNNKKDSVKNNDTQVLSVQEHLMQLSLKLDKFATKLSEIEHSRSRSNSVDSRKSKDNHNHHHNRSTDSSSHNNNTNNNYTNNRDSKKYQAPRGDRRQGNRQQTGSVDDSSDDTHQSDSKRQSQYNKYNNNNQPPTRDTNHKSDNHYSRGRARSRSGSRTGNGRD
jgi:hypothetical protein